MGRLNALRSRSGCITDLLQTRDRFCLSAGRLAPNLDGRIIVVFDATVDGGGLAGSVATVLARNVRHLEPKAASFAAMLDGWGLQQRSRFLKASTIGTRRDMVRRFARFTNKYPWQWRSVEVEAFVTSLRSGGEPVAPSTARGYQNALRLFVEYVTDPRYGWPEHCSERFGAAPSKILHEWNTVTLVTEYEGDPRRRPLTYDEVQALFDAAESLVEQIRIRGRKGALAAQRDAVLLKAIYAFGLRRREAWGLDLADLHHNPNVAHFGRVGGVFVRWGKSSKGSQPKRRTVFLVPEMDWLVPIVDQWLDDLRPAFGAGDHPAMWSPNAVAGSRCAVSTRHSSTHASRQDSRPSWICTVSDTPTSPT